MLPSRFNLGVFGLPVNLLAMAFLAVVFIMVSSACSELHSAGRTSIDLELIRHQAFFPPTPLPNLELNSMNWSSLVFSSVALWGVIFYFVWARYRYVGPVEYVRKLD